MPDMSSSSTLSRPMLASPDGRNTACTASAELPVSANLRTMASAMDAWFSVGSIAEVRMMSGMSAVNACEAMTVARSMPWMAKKQRRQRRGNHSSSSTFGSRIGPVCGPRPGARIISRGWGRSACRTRANGRPAAGVTPAG